MLVSPLVYIFQSDYVNLTLTVPVVWYNPPIGTPTTAAAASFIQLPVIVNLPDKELLTAPIVVLIELLTAPIVVLIELLTAPILVLIEPLTANIVVLVEPLTANIVVLVELLTAPIVVLI